MRGHRQGGGAQPDGLQDDDRNEQGRFEWTNDLRDDLLDCYESSSPARRGYMGRMHELWSGMHPEYDTFTAQGLRDYVSYLRRRGYVRGPQQPAVPEEQEPQIHIAEEAPPVAPEERLRDRTALHKTKRPKPQDLARANEELLNALTEEADIWRINCAVYEAVCSLSPRVHNRDSCVDRAQRRVKKMDAKILSARQQASRIQCVVEYKLAARPYTPKDMEIRHLFLTTILLSALDWVRGHGRLIEPPSRASAWRYGFDTPHNYNDHELYCGGFTRQWVKNEGKCGVCGDPWDSKKPRAHEYGGVYGQGLIVRKYGLGGIINIRVELTANHFGYFEFRICPDFKTTNQDCLDQNILKLVKPQEGVNHKNYRYFPKEGNKIYEMKYRLPKKTCKHCVLQWKYIAGNNWGNCPNGTGAVGCGPQEEFRACSDITISGKATDEPMVPPTVPVAPDEDYDDYNELEPPSSVVPPADEIPKPEGTYNPVSALIISVVSFLVAFLILFLLYFHFYQVGKRIREWLKSKTENKGEQKVSNMQHYPPMVPSRSKKRPAPQPNPNVRYGGANIA
ncbi:unnamed protein product [Ceutorhynchus assimilis]|uniref:Chitin-binding type-4 domain-containing protein n=1 Tax=Ceutorhynchus assimilis TaxID=467358 RepID=A0A9N9MU53_9CUCU|nr:unnamed protein product [Ceutorhynchus assimilis]